MSAMPYESFIRDLTEEINRSREDDPLPPEAVREVLEALPAVLSQLEEDQWVKVPFGTFRMGRQKRRRLRIPGSDVMGHVEEKLLVKFKAGKCLHFPAPKESRGSDLG